MIVQVLVTKEPIVTQVRCYFLVYQKAYLIDLCNQLFLESQATLLFCKSDLFIILCISFHSENLYNSK